MKKCFLVAGLGIFSLTTFAQGYVESSDAVTAPVNNRLMVTPPKAPAQFSLFGEAMPLNDMDVKERLERELLVNTYLQGSNLYILLLSTRWLPMIEEKLKTAGIPDDFKYLCVAESALQNQISKVGATGFWQFMKGTGPGYGLEINSHVDERYNPAKSTDAAIKYLQQAYNKFGNWTAAAASYNCGMGGYNQRAVQQGTQNFYNLYLPEETMRYIFRIAALKHILENPAEAGFNVPDGDAYLPLKTKKITVNYPIGNLVKFAADNGSNYKMLKVYNPWLRGTSLPNRTGKAYIIELPE